MNNAEQIAKLLHESLILSLRHHEIMLSTRTTSTKHRSDGTVVHMDCRCADGSGLSVKWENRKGFTVDFVSPAP